MQQADLFGSHVQEQTGKKRGRGAAASKQPQHQKKSRERHGVCECGSGKFRLSISAGVMTRTCKNEKCKKQVVV